MKYVKKRPILYEKLCMKVYVNGEKYYSMHPKKFFKAKGIQ